MNIKPIIRLGEVRKTIILSNPEGRKLIIIPEETGIEVEKIKTFTNIKIVRVFNGVELKEKEAMPKVLEIIGNNFKEDINNNYPILNWQ